MWLWLVLSILILAACVIFALKIFSSNYGLGTLGDNSFKIKREPVSVKAIQKVKPNSDVKIKLQAIEDNSLVYISQLNKLQSRLDMLEKTNGKPISTVKKNYDDNDDWEEMYYKARDAKEKLEEEISTIKEKFDTLESAQQEMEKEYSILAEKKSVLESELEEIYALQNKLSELERELQGSAEREKELLEQLNSTGTINHEYKMLQKQYGNLKMETDELRARLQEMNSRDALLQKKVSRLSELESNIEMSEFEKAQLRKSVEDIITENETLAAKLLQLQDKLSVEKYA